MRQIIKVRFWGVGGRGRERAASPHRVLSAASNVTAPHQRTACQGLTAGWLLSCFRTTPSIDDMATGATRRQVMGPMRTCGRKCALVWMSRCVVSLFVQVRTQSAKCWSRPRCQPIPRCDDNSCTCGPCWSVCQVLKKTAHRVLTDAQDK